MHTSVIAIPECETCGRSAELVKSHIENALLSVCRKCAGLGKVLKDEAAPPARRQEPKIAITELIPDFPAAIRASREAQKITRKGLAQKIREKESVVARIENGMRPTEQLIGKLEKALGIALSYEEKEQKLPKVRTEELTVGDILEIRMRKRA